METDIRTGTGKVLLVGAGFVILLIILIASGSYLAATRLLQDDPPPERRLNIVAETPSTIKKTPQNQFSASQTANLQILEQNAKNIEEYLQMQGVTRTTGIYFEDLSESRVKFSYNSNKNFYPASTYKVPLAMLVLKQAELGNIDLSKQIYHERRNGQGETRSLREIMELMIKESDNDAMGVFETELGGYNASQELMEQELGVRIERRTQVTTPAKTAQVLRTLYKGEYLSEQHNKLLLDLMKNVEPEFADRIIAATKELNQEHGTILTAASKIGNLSGKYHDTGFVFGEESDYLIVIFTNNRQSHAQANAEIKQITKLLLEGLEYTNEQD